MIGLRFVDTNVLIYAHDKDAGNKSKRAADTLAELWESGAGALSVQVLQEFYINVTQKIANPISKAEAREVVRLYAVWVKAPTSPETVLRASEISEVWRLSFWDGLIMAAAEQIGCTVLLSEDLGAGQVIAGIKIVNPLLTV